MLTGQSSRRRLAANQVDACLDSYSFRSLNNNKKSHPTYNSACSSSRGMILSTAPSPVLAACCSCPFHKQQRLLGHSGSKRLVLLKQWRCCSGPQTAGSSHRTFYCGLQPSDFSISSASLNRVEHATLPGVSAGPSLSVNKMLDGKEMAKRVKVQQVSSECIGQH